MIRVLRGLWLLSALAVQGLAGQGASAQPSPDPGRELKLIESTEAGEDPLGIDDSTGKELDRAAARLKPQAPTVVLPTPNRGAALSAIAGVQESAHSVDVELGQGLAFITARSTIVSRAKHPAELSYRFALPAHAAVTSVKLCAQKRCRDALPSVTSKHALYRRTLAQGGGNELALAAERIVDSEGHALAVSVAPIAQGAQVELEIHYVSEAPVRGGKARFRLGSRGYDPNLAPAAVTLRSRELSALQPGAEFELEPWGSVELSGTLSTARTNSEVRARCGDAECVRRYEAAALSPPTLRPTWLLIDASPSMEGPARGRASTTVAALLSVLPDNTELRALAFAARAQEIGRFPAADAPLTELADAPLRELDAATHLKAALSPWQGEIARIKPRIVVLSDGLFDPIASERDALLQAKRLGAELSLVVVGDHEPRFRELFARVLGVAELADLALKQGSLEPLADALRVLVSRGQGGLSAGEQRVSERAPKKAWLPATHAHWLSHWFSRARPAAWSLLDPTPTGAAVLAIPYTTMTNEAPTQASTAMPAESVLTMLRNQLVPQARACLRSDRKGRGDYAVGLTFHALFAQREAYESRVEGNIAPALRSCLEAIVPKLRVPAFTGKIRVKYPIHTEREAAPPVIELEPDVSQTLERAFGATHALP